MTIAASSVEAVTDLTAQHGGLVQCAYVGGETVPGTSSKRHPLYEWGWNHTTLRALREGEEAPEMPLNVCCESVISRSR